MATKINWKRRRSRSANEPHGNIAPLRVRNLTLGELPMGNFARRKNREHASLLQPIESFPQSAMIRVAGPIGFKWIDENAMRFQLWHIGQQDVGHHLHVWPYSQEQCRQSGAVQHAERMICHHHHRPGCRHSRHILCIRAQCNPHFAEKVFQPETIGGKTYAAIKIPHFSNGNKSSRQRGDTAEFESPRQHIPISGTGWRFV